LPNREFDSDFVTRTRWATPTVCMAANPITKAVLDLTQHPCNYFSDNSPPKIH
jgi:hypothetical protein